VRSVQGVCSNRPRALVSWGVLEATAVPNGGGMADWLVIGLAHKSSLRTTDPLEI